ncbi:MAG: thioredoxin family protein, partial [Clostridia bacterium]|nr:thioredoxin family protein [Clostridia bacterium]
AFVASDTPVLVDFYTEGCPRCQAMSHVLEEVTAVRPALPVGRINVSEETDLANAYVVRITPTVMVMQNGDIAARFTGSTDVPSLLNAVDSGYPHPPEPVHPLLHDYAPYHVPRMYSDPFSAPDPLTGQFF